MRPLIAFIVVAAMLVACSGQDSGDPNAESPTAGDPTVASNVEPLSGDTTADTAQTNDATPAIETPTVLLATPTNIPDPLSVSACDGPLPGGVAPGVSLARQFDASGEERSYRIYLPPTYRPSETLSAILNFHAGAATPEEQEELSGLRALAESGRFALVSPAWSANGAVPSTAGDAAFVDDLLHDLAGLVCFDPDRVYATGFAEGGFMTSLVACTLPHRVSAVAPVAGANFPATKCRKEVPILAFHGTADDVVPLDGGSLQSGSSYDGARAAVAAWAELGNCRADAYPEPITNNASREGYGPCDRGGSIGLVVVEGFGHDWPNDDNAGFSAAELIWDFFDDYPLQ